MPRVDDPRKFAEEEAKEEEEALQASYDDARSEPRYKCKKVYNGAIAAILLALAFVYLLSPLYDVSEGGYATLFDASVGTGEKAAGYLSALCELLLSGYMVSILFMEFDKAEKRGFFGYVLMALGNLVMTFAFGILGNTPLMVIALVTAALSLLFMYLDFRFFHDL